MSIQDPGYRPDQWGTAGDHERRIRVLEAIPADSGGQGCRLPCPPWTVDYDTGEVVGTTYVDTGIYPTPLILQIIDAATAFQALVAQINGSLPDGGNLTGLSITQAIDGSGVVVGATIGTTQDTGGTSDGLIIAVVDGGGGATAAAIRASSDIEAGTSEGFRFASRCGDGVALGLQLLTQPRAATAGDVFALGIDAQTTGRNADASNTISAQTDGTGDAKGLVLNADATGSGAALALQTTAGGVEVTLQTGEKLVVKDSGGSPVFEVREDGTVHILTGGTIVADL